MNYNMIFSIKQKISRTSDLEKLISESKNVFDDITKIYSYIIYSEYKDEDFVGWIIQYNISQTDEYNTIDVEKSLSEIVVLITNDRRLDDNEHNHVIGYRQPSLELQIKVYDPLINNLAIKMYNRWPSLEYDDLYQMCRLSLIVLYNKGYYIHKRLLEKSFYNTVLISMRKMRGQPEILSLEQKYNGDDKEKLTLADSIPDEEAEEQEALNDIEECNKLVYKKLKELIVGIVGERGYQELLRDYGNKHTSNISRKMLQKVKAKFDKQGITIKSFDKYY